MCTYYLPYQSNSSSFMRYGHQLISIAHGLFSSSMVHIHTTSTCRIVLFFLNTVICDYIVVLLCCVVCHINTIIQNETYTQFNFDRHSYRFRVPCRSHKIYKIFSRVCSNLFSFSTWFCYLCDYVVHVCYILLCAYGPILNNVIHFYWSYCECGCGLYWFDLK